MDVCNVCLCWHDGFSKKGGHVPVILVWYPPGSIVWTDTPKDVISRLKTSVYASRQYFDIVYGAGGKANRPTTLAVFTTRPPASRTKGRNVFVTLIEPSKLMFNVACRKRKHSLYMTSSCHAVCLRMKRGWLFSTEPYGEPAPLTNKNFENHLFIC